MQHEIPGPSSEPRIFRLSIHQLVYRRGNMLCLGVKFMPFRSTNRMRILVRGINSNYVTKFLLDTSCKHYALGRLGDIRTICTICVHVRKSFGECRRPGNSIIPKQQTVEQPNSITCTRIIENSCKSNSYLKTRSALFLLK